MQFSIPGGLASLFELSKAITDAYVMPTLSMSINKILLILSTHLKEKRHLSKRMPQEMVRNTHGRHISETGDKTDSIENV